MDDRVILMVEDDPDDAELIHRALRRVGVSYPIRVVNDGGAALDYIDAQGRYADRRANPPPSLVLLDLKLPIRSGFEVLDHLRRRDELAKVVVVVLATSRQPDDVGLAYAKGANSYLVKPIRPTDLEALMERVNHYWLHSNEPPPQFSSPSP